jgi:hypothetical protein
MSNKVLTTFSTLLLLTLVVAGMSPALAATSPTLGMAYSYGILGASTVTNTGSTSVIGDLGVSPGSAVTGFPPGTVSGTINKGDANASAAQAGNTAAFTALNQICTNTYAGVQDLTLISPLGPGVYCAPAFILTGNLDLSGSGVWIFKSDSTLITSPGSSVTGGNQCDVWWRVGSSATVDIGTSFKGNILALASITLSNGATLAGRALAQTGAVTMDNNAITSSICEGPPPPVPELPTLLLTSTGIFGLLLIRRKRKNLE